MTGRFRKRLIATAAGAALLTSAAQAHHGWSWAEEQQVDLEGTIRDIYIGPPHPRLQVETADGTWTVELGNPTQTQRSGFVEGSAKPGDVVLARGNKPREGDEKRLKAVQITIGGKRYDLYPERIQPK